MRGLGKNPKPKETTILATGCFDLLHYGHVRYLEKVKKYGNRLIVAIANDSLTRRKKGAARPIIPEKHRAYLLRSLRMVDKVCICHSNSEVLKAVKENHVDIFCISDRDLHREKEMRARQKFYEKNVPGIRFVRTSYKKGKLSTTKIIHKILSLHNHKRI